MNRMLWGATLIVLGLLGFLQVVGEVNFGLAFWPVVLVLLSITFLSSGIRRRAWFPLALGVWVLGIGVFDMLHNAGVTEASGSTVVRVGWPLMFVGVGLAVMMRQGDRVWGRKIHGPRKTGFVGDLRYGREPWVLDKDLSLEHQVGDMRLDLTTAEITDGVHHIRVRARAGEVAVVVPNDVIVRVDARLGVGDLEVFKDRRSGVGLELQKELYCEGTKKELRLDVRLNVGRLSVRAEPPQIVG